jgi:probable F420-dependent oxidoreductase
VTGILILPQRQTALVAKQAAAIDVLSRGRLRLGVGIGWNYTEYEGLNEDFSTRGRRMSEQVEVLRRLWSEPVVTYEGRWHHLNQVGINPLPVQQPIPIWMGGMAEAVLKRMARLAVGWFPQFRPSDEARATLERLRGYISTAGRDPSAFGIEGRISITSGEPGEWREQAEAWRALGATHLSVNTMGGGFTSPGRHIEAVQRFKEAMK